MDAMGMFTLGWKRALGLLTGLLSVVGGAAHGYLAVPAARNVQHNSHYCPQCLNGPGVCGDPAGVRDHSTGKFSKSKTVKAYAPGSVLKANVVITANHEGRWGLGLCPHPTADAKCFRPLKLVGGGTHVYLGKKYRSSGSFRLPKIKCKNCVLRWRYETGNSCNPRGTPRAYWNSDLEVCGKWIDPEIFTNCADIRIG